MTPTHRPSLPTAVGLVLVGVASVQARRRLREACSSPTSSPTAWSGSGWQPAPSCCWCGHGPGSGGRSRADWWVVVRYGACLGTMNWAIYQSFSRIPIGVAVTIEFVGPLVLAAVGFRRPRDLAWVLLAAVGVVLLGFEHGHLDPAGIGFALLAGAAWAGYILSSAATGARWQGIDGLAAAALIAVVLVSPLLVTVDGGDLADSRILLIGAAVGLLDSVVPYSAESGRPAHAAGGDLQRAAEPGAGRGRARRAGRGRGGPGARAVAGGRLCRGRQRRRDPGHPAADSPRCHPGVTRGTPPAPSVGPPTRHRPGGVTMSLLSLSRAWAHDTEHRAQAEGPPQRDDRADGLHPAPCRAGGGGALPGRACSHLRRGPARRPRLAPRLAARPRTRGSGRIRAWRPLLPARHRSSGRRPWPSATSCPTTAPTSGPGPTTPTG
ncbi:hypothetical protein [Nocardioides convexus]|uniref:hypothetical protein n=1 Tax=Nocardioides convexus TaxID=2712224 RepID=UPI0024183204|nr:hypothetical protein [Nocardioides convexus]